MKKITIAFAALCFASGGACAASFEVFPYSGNSGIAKEMLNHVFRAIVFDNTTRNIYYCTTTVHIPKGSTFMSYTCERSKNHKSLLPVSPTVQTSVHVGGSAGGLYESVFAAWQIDAANGDLQFCFPPGVLNNKEMANDCLKIDYKNPPK
ncbi:MAG: hypothetical protein WB816_05345 [Methylocystis sp.]